MSHKMTLGLQNTTKNVYYICNWSKINLVTTCHLVTEEFIRLSIITPLYHVHKHNRTIQLKEHIIKKIEMYYRKPFKKLHLMGLDVLLYIYLKKP